MRFRDQGEIRRALERLKPKIEANSGNKIYSKFSDELLGIFEAAMDDAIYDYSDGFSNYARTESLRDSIRIRKTERGVFIYVDRNVLYELNDERQEYFNPNKAGRKPYPYDLYTSGKDGPSTLPSGMGWFTTAHELILNFVAGELITGGGL